MSGCCAAWSDVKVSSADNRTSPCCELLGPAPATFNPDMSLRSPAELWNDPQMHMVRRAQSGGKNSPGCDGCVYSIDTPEPARKTYRLFQVPDSLTAEQAANLALAWQEYDATAIHLKSLPLRYTLFFGWFCNIDCMLCNQLPHRDSMPQTLPSDIFEQWREPFRSALEVECIGGEPFAIPSAVAFMRKFVTAEDLTSVRMRITTNATIKLSRGTRRPV